VNADVKQPYVARLIVFYLLEQSEVTEVVGQAIYTDLPHDETFPAVRITQLGDGTDGLGFLGQTVIQVDTWGPGISDRLAAHDLCETVGQALRRMHDRVEAGGAAAVVTDVRVGTARDDIDKTYTPARPTSRLTATFWATPA